MIQMGSKLKFRIITLVLIPVVLLSFGLQAAPVHGDDLPTVVDGISTNTEVASTQYELTESYEQPTTIPVISESPPPTLPTEEQKQTSTPESTITYTPSIIPSISIPTETIEEMVSLLVKVNPGMDGHIRSTFSGKYSLGVDPILAAVNISVIKVPVSKKKEVLEQLRELPGVEFAEGEKEIHALDYVPNDPFIDRQYALTSIHAFTAWDYLPPVTTAPIIAIIDTGIDLSHAEFAGRLLPGYDFYNDDTNPQDDNGHGSHVAGIAAGGGNNAAGIAGICWDAQVIPIKVLNSSGNGTYSDVARGIIWAVDHGAEIINLSLGAPSYSNTLEDAVNYAIERGVILVAATGNAGSAGVYYPAAYPGVVAVAAVDQGKNHAVFSNYGPQVDLSAPGVNIYSTNAGGTYSYRSGTSMAAPMVTGSIALITELFGYSPASALYLLEDTAEDLGVLSKDSYFGYGLIRLDRVAEWSLATATPRPELTDHKSNDPVYGFIPGTSTLLVPSAMLSSPTDFISETPAVGQIASNDSILVVTATPTYTVTASVLQAQADSTENPTTYPWVGWILIGLGIVLFMSRGKIVGRVFPPHQ